MRGGSDTMRNCCRECALARCRRWCAGASQLQGLSQALYARGRRFDRPRDFRPRGQATPAAHARVAAPVPGARGGVKRGAEPASGAPAAVFRRFAAELRRAAAAPTPRRLARRAASASSAARARLARPRAQLRRRASSAARALLASAVVGPAGSPRPWPLTPGGLRRTRRLGWRPTWRKHTRMWAASQGLALYAPRTARRRCSKTRKPTAATAGCVARGAWRPVWRCAGRHRAALGRVASGSTQPCLPCGWRAFWAWPLLRP